MNKYLSDKIKTISFVMMIMVVFIHSYNLEIKFKFGTELIKRGYNSFFQDIISQGITRVAVPMFFIISGYLFFLNIKSGFLKEFIKKYKKKGETLILPYLFWSIFGIFFYLLLQLIPLSKPFFVKELIVEYSFFQVLERVFINPIPYQLWFIRDLIVLIIISPLLYWLIKNIKFYGLLPLFVLWFISFNFILFSDESFLFFTIGSFFSIQKINIQNKKQSKKYLFFFALWIILIFIKTILLYYNFKNEILINLFHKSSILMGVVSLWFIYDVVFKNVVVSETKFYGLFQYTFFLYASHEPILTIIKKTFYFFLGQSELSSLFIYLTTPLITIFICIVIGLFLKKLVPSFYYIITGGR